MPGVARWLALVVVLALPAAAAAQQAGATRTASVTYLSPGWVFLDAGSADGLRSGGRVEVVRRGRTIAVLRVESLGEHQATCAVLSTRRPPVLGDSVRFVALAPPPSQPPVAARPPAPGPDVAATQPAAVAHRPAVAAPRDSADAAPSPTVAAARSPSPPRPVAASPTPPTREAAVPATASAETAPPVVRRDTVRGPPRITFLTTASVYVSAGAGDGLGPGSRVDVVRGGRTVAELAVVFVSTRQASCKVASQTDSVRVGDLVRFTPVVVPVVVAQDTARATGTPVAQAGGRRARRSGPRSVRGRVSLHYLAVQQRDSFGGRFSQPAGDLRLTGARMGGSPLGLMLDVRTRNQIRDLPGSAATTSSQTRVYQAAAVWDAPGSPFRFTTGRQYAPGISSVGLLDGASAEAGFAKWDFGLFAGMQPELVNLAFSSDITQAGGYLRWHSRPASGRRWAMTLGASGSEVDGNSNRDFVYVQANYLTRRVSFYVVQEVDYYRPSRRVNGEHTVSPTSTFANLQYQLTGGLSFTAGVDNRRSVRLYRDVVDPATEFDDAFRRGVWAGLALRGGNHFRVAFDARTNDGGSNDAASTFTLALSADRLTPLGASFRSRSTRYTTGGRDGWLNSVSFGLEPFGRGSAQLASGWRTERDGALAQTLNVRWMSLDMDVSIARSIFAVFSGYRERGGIGGHDQFYVGLSYRF